MNHSHQLLLPKVRLDIVSRDADAEPVANAIAKSAVNDRDHFWVNGLQMLGAKKGLWSLHTA